MRRAILRVLFLAVPLVAPPGDPAHADRLKIDVDVDADPDTAAVVIDSAATWESGGPSESNAIVRMGENISIEEGETIDGDVVVIGGTVTVAGHVKGDVVCVGGSLVLKPTAVVEKDAVSVGGMMEKQEGAIVRGQNVSVGGLPSGFARWVAKAAGAREHHGEGGPANLWWDFLRYAGCFAVGMILFLAMPKRILAVRGSVRSRFWLSLVVGFGSLLGIFVVFVLLCITCIGILVAIPGMLVVGLAVVGAGAVAVSLLGELILRRRVTDNASWAATLAAGLGALFVIQILARLLASGSADFVGRSLQTILNVAWAVLLFTGFGSLVLTRLGMRSDAETPTGFPVTGPQMPAQPKSPTA
ncbi:MAG: hypothetical protein ACE15D_06630 [Candidatus Eisenbacteria bacterium]|nr:hypothetical protein [Candidatus Eisenbacteria bacterium]